MKDLEEFKKLLNKFKKELNKDNLTEKVINAHIENVRFYYEDYLLYYDENGLSIENAVQSLNMFFSDWYIRKCCSSISEAKSIIGSLNKFFKFLLEEKIINIEIHKDYKEVISSYKQDWFEEIEKYNYKLMNDCFDEEEDLW